MHLLNNSEKPWSNEEFIIRSLDQGPNYSPDWRRRVLEQYVVEISRAEKKSVAVDRILVSERDPILRQLMLFHSGRRCVISGAINYALQCIRHQSETSIPALIKAMVVARCGAEHIAAQVGSTPLNVRIFEKICFDVRRYGSNRIWLRNICLP